MSWEWIDPVAHLFPTPKDLMSQPFAPSPWRPRGECRQSRLTQKHHHHVGVPSDGAAETERVDDCDGKLVSTCQPTEYRLIYTLRIQVCPKKAITPPLHSYSKDGIGTLNPILGRGLDS